LQSVIPDKVYDLGIINVVAAGSGIEDFSISFNELISDAKIKGGIPDLAAYFEKKPDKELRLSIDMMGMGSMRMGDEVDSAIDGIEWEDKMGMMNNMATNKSVTWQIIDKETGKINDYIDWKFEQGDYVKVRVFNDPDSMHPMQHPIHFHGQRFIVLSTDEKRNNNFVWKDTVLVPAGKTVDLLVEMSNQGNWMAHCHIAEHLHSDMMFDFDVF